MTQADHPLPVVRRPGRGGGELLLVDLQELEDRARRPLQPTDVPDPDGPVMTVDIRARRAAVHGAQRRPAVQVHRGRLVLSRLRTQEEVDYYWDEAAPDGGERSQCGWLKDKYGVSWQVVPRRAQRDDPRSRPRSGRPGDAADADRWSSSTSRRFKQRSTHRNCCI